MTTTDPAATAGRRYYDGPDVTDRVLAAIRAAGLDPDHLDADDLAALDEFHALGRAATTALAGLAAIAPGERVVDVGAGIGGPARFLAGHLGAHVTAVEPAARFRRLAQALSRGAGLADRVTVVEGAAERLPLPDGAFDVAWTVAVSQNVPDKAAMVRELARVVRPGGRVAMFEVLQGPGGPPHFPVPWADGPAESFLAAPADLRGLAEAAGLEPTVWNEGPEALAEIQRAAATDPPAAGTPGLALDLLLPDLQERMANVGRNVGERRISLLQAVFTRGVDRSPIGSDAPASAP